MTNNESEKECPNCKDVPFGNLKEWISNLGETNWIGNYEFKVAVIYRIGGQSIQESLERELRDGWLLVGFCSGNGTDNGIFAKLK